MTPSQSVQVKVIEITIFQDREKGIEFYKESLKKTKKTTYDMKYHTYTVLTYR